MTARIAASIALALALAACEQTSQTLPFSADVDQPSVRTITAADAAVITSAAGLALEFPAGSVNQATEISIAPVAPPASIAASGSPVSRGFRVDPADLVLNQPAQVMLRMDPELDSTRVWLASLVVVTSDGVEEIGNTRLDLRAGLAEAAIDRLGTLAIVIPEPRAVFITRSGAVQPVLGPAAGIRATAPTARVVGDCGGRGARCDGLSVTTSENLRDKVEQAAAVYPRVSGSLSIDGTRATGEIALTSSLRLLLRSGATSANVEMRGRLRPTAATVVAENESSIILTNVLVRVTGGDTEAGSSETTRTVVIQKRDGVGFATFSRSFELGDPGDRVNDASIAITFPVRLNP